MILQITFFHSFLYRYRVCSVAFYFFFPLSTRFSALETFLHICLPLGVMLEKQQPLSCLNCFYCKAWETHAWCRKGNTNKNWEYGGPIEQMQYHPKDALEMHTHTHMPSAGCVSTSRLCHSSKNTLFPEKRRFLYERAKTTLFSTANCWQNHHKIKTLFWLVHLGPFARQMPDFRDKALWLVESKQLQKFDGEALRYTHYSCVGVQIQFLSLKMSNSPSFTYKLV